ncbi:RNA-binding domain-containing protein [Thiothrix winogradskyi]|uniref:DNA binding domain-containing protein n=1 Tax=Thiothrix winogradskyi TaxID=96472 RepID=A0ABY3SZE3_9GAMM|nr:RNA-binding domain-containing protein [Thiothrix winogradskyi]UJS24589.1 putative DNA binding domain-containing protein [Thiothrix winogradskyi]
MDIATLQAIVDRGEDGQHQFKSDVSNINALAAEIVAFSNSVGGIILIGINDDGSFTGLNREDMGRLNQLVSNAASQSVRPPVNPQTENIATPNGLVMAVQIPQGISKPYMDNNGLIWVKSGADKRKVTAREEIQRMYQSAGLLHGDEIPAKGLTVNDLDKDYFAGFLQKHFNTDVNTLDVPLPTLLENMNLMRDGTLNVAGALLFTRNPSFYLPTFVLKAIAFPGNTIDVNTYLDSQDMSGKLLDVFQQTLSFVMRNLHHVQAGQNVNSLGELEIPRVVFEELITNALIHRDYFVSATIRLFIFKDRIEIISPGHLPNNLTITKIKLGNSNIRNPILVSFASRILPYRGLGSGIVRALSAYPDIEFVDDRENNLFKAIIKRPPFPALP